MTVLFILIFILPIATAVILAGKKGKSKRLWGVLAAVISWVAPAILFFSKDTQAVATNSNWLGDDAGLNPDYSYSAGQDGIAIGKLNRKLLLQSGGRRKIYDFADVRSWRYNVAAGGKTMALNDIGMGGTILLAQHNRNIDKANEASSGLFIQVRDIDYPEWHIHFASTSDRVVQLKRWHEILNQFVGER